MSVCFRLHWTPALVGAVVLAASATPLRAETRALSFFNTHTQERATIVFKRNGQFDPAGLQELNRMLRDWRRNESTRMDSQLFDLIWEVYRESGSKEPIHIVSGYRSPATNGALRSRSRGVAKFSQHMLGKAMDFYLPDVPLANLRAIGMKKQTGGVGFYPTSGSPFVHMDTGSVRAWPRMSRDQLVRLFPDGKTAHLPADGSPLPRYQEALAEVQSRKGRGTTAVASSGGSSAGGNIFASIFGSGSSASSSEDDEEEAPRAAPRPQELRQGPLPAAATPPAAAPRTVVAAATPEPAGETFVPPPPPAPKGPVALRAPVAPPPAPTPIPVAVAAAPAPGSLVALPMPAPAPRAPGSLVAAATPTANGLPIPPSPSALPPGWMQGPQGRPVAAAPAAATPTAAAPTTVAALPEGFAQPRGKPAPVGASAPAAEAIAILTGSQSDRVGAQVLGYAPNLPVPKPSPGGLSSVSRPAAGAGIVVAALPPQAAVALSEAMRPLPVAAAAALPARKGDRVDPLARLVGKPADRTEGRLMDSTGSTRTAAFADLSHPDQEHLPQLLAKPTQLVLSGSDALGSELRADRFAGPAVVALTVLRTE